MRTSRFSCLPLRVSRISSCATSARELRSRSNRGPNSGIATEMWAACPPDSGSARSRSAERLTKVTRPSSLSPTTPAVTEESTESNSRRRASIWRLFSKSASRWRLSWRVIWLKIRPSMAISSSPSSSVTCTSRSPEPTLCAAPASRPTGPESRPANHRPSQIEARITISANPR